MSVLDNIENQSVDVQKIIAAPSPFLSIEESNMCFSFSFSINENVSYSLLMIRGMLINMLDVLSSSTQVRRLSVGDIRVPSTHIEEVKRIFYDREIFSNPTVSVLNSWIFGIYMDVEQAFTVPEALRIIRPVCQILQLTTRQNYINLTAAKIFRNNTKQYNFKIYIEYISAMKSRFRNVDEEKVISIWNYLKNIFYQFYIYELYPIKFERYKRQLSIYLGSKSIIKNH